MRRGYKANDQTLCKHVSSTRSRTGKMGNICTFTKLYSFLGFERIFYDKFFVVLFSLNESPHDVKEKCLGEAESVSQHVANGVLVTGILTSFKIEYNKYRSL